jgi:hypothetical protein
VYTGLIKITETGTKTAFAQTQQQHCRDGNEVKKWVGDEREIHGQAVYQAILTVHGPGRCHAL